MTAATWTIAIATVVYVLVSSVMLYQLRESVKVARKATELAHRPFVGCMRVDVELEDIAVPGCERPGRRVCSTIAFKNVGTVPAREIDANFIPALGDFKMRKEGIRHRNLVLFPGVEHYLWGFVDILPVAGNEVAFDHVAALEEEPLTLVVHVRYKGTGDVVFRTRQEYKYLPKSNAFAHVGGEAT